MISPDHDLSDLPQLLAELLKLRNEVYEEGQAKFREWQPDICQRIFLPSALNLAYYLALRRRDLRPIQAALTPWGLSSLGRLEARVLPSLDAVIATLGALAGADLGTLPKRPRHGLIARGARLLNRKTAIIFGEQVHERRVRIMVTLPSEAATNYELVRDLLVSGMDCVRINCAHDTPDDWAGMIANLRGAEAETGRKCKVAMDLGGPKIRTEDVIAPKGERLHTGDRYLLTFNKLKKTDEFTFQARCTLPEVFEQVKLGAQVWHDDGKLGAIVEAVRDNGLVLRVTSAGAAGEKLRKLKGLNFPDTDLNLNPLTDKDLSDLDFVATHADMVNYSFVQDAADIRLLQEALAERMENPNKIAIIAKIETQRAVQNLPALMVQAAGQQPFGVMIARGDLAVEIGYQRMVEIQEEILWLCEAAHVPVIWATQVLESLVKNGRPSRGEMTDAAMGERAECIMLNKGPYARQAVMVLDDVLTRMQQHQSKKTAQLRALSSW